MRFGVTGFSTLTGGGGGGGGAAVGTEPMMPPSTPPGVPPATPPGTPPTTPATPLVGGGSSSSLIVAISLGTTLGRHQPAGVELARNHLDDFTGGGSGGRRRRRRRRRRRHQETGQLRLGKDIEVNHRQDHCDDDKDDLRKECDQNRPGFLGLALRRMFAQTYKAPFPFDSADAHRKCPPADLIYLTAFDGLLRAVSGSRRRRHYRGRPLARLSV